jgi:CheY-like chemotaxis protein
MNALIVKNKTAPQILVIEDSDEDYEMLRYCVKKEAWLDIYALQRYETGEDAIDALSDYKLTNRSQSDNNIYLILLDLNLPGEDGKDILRYIKGDAALRTIPVVIFSTSSNPKDIMECYQQGANSYVTKPMDVQCLKSNLQGLFGYWLNINRQ